MAILCGGPSATAQVAFLQPGDIALTCVDTSGTGSANDHLQIMPLVPLPALIDPTFQLQYTDREANSAGVFDANNENALAVPITGPRSAGEPYDYLAVGIGNPDEQVFLFQGKLNESAGVLTTGTLLWGFQISSVGGWASVRTDALSELPTVLASAGVALTTNGSMKFAYTGPTTGTKTDLQASIARSDNWTTNADCPIRLTVIEPFDGGVDDAGVPIDDGGGTGGAAGAASGDDGGVGGSSSEGGSTGFDGAVGSGDAIGGGGMAGDIMAGNRGSGGGGGDPDAAIDAADDAEDADEVGANLEDAAIERSNVFVATAGGSTGHDGSEDASDGSTGRAHTKGGGCSCVAFRADQTHRPGSAGLAALMTGLVALRRRRRRPVS